MFCFQTCFSNEVNCRMHKLCQSKLFPFSKERVHTIQPTTVHPKAIIHTHDSNILSQDVNPFTYGVFLIVSQTKTTLLTSRPSKRNSRIAFFHSHINLQQDKWSTPRVTTFCVRVRTFSIMSLTVLVGNFQRLSCHKRIPTDKMQHCVGDMPRVTRASPTMSKRTSSKVLHTGHAYFPTAVETLLCHTDIWIWPIRYT